MKKRRLVVFLAITFVLTFALTPVVAAKSYGADISKQLADVRKETAKYHDIQAAFDDGYETDYGVVPNMGIHLVRNDLLADPNLDPIVPEVLVYEPKKNGGYKLVALEYMTAGGERPSLFGQEFDDGPFPGSFALHAWIWQANPDGMFAEFNPNVANVEEE
ncbi:hypothetical protein [Salinibacillus xinjiangensis]|uniref:Uncharacterized protein n=1 Tax=Salinibacillus xinjiangensis TaxID=1229268 RepID=A0A6G1XA58_9BACI|nr:hypothetical protein [Salinibacillus xinjiangensis]MRG87760.1 hypothetical protein [Salinibacillus xinjiangensis]